MVREVIEHRMGYDRSIVGSILPAVRCLFRKSRLQVRSRGDVKKSVSLSRRINRKEYYNVLNKTKLFKTKTDT